MTTIHRRPISAKLGEFQNGGRMRNNSWLFIRCFLVIGLATLGFGMPWLGHALCLSPQLAGTFSGALVGAAAAMLGTLLTHFHQRSDDAAEKESRRQKIKALIASELVNTAAGYIGAHSMVSAAVGAAEAGGSILSQVDFTNELPRPMPRTASLGADLLVLSEREIDVISTLSSNMSLTTQTMREISAGQRPWGLLAATALLSGIRHDLGILAEVFDEFAPTRQLGIGNRAPEPAVNILRRLSNGSRAEE